VSGAANRADVAGGTRLLDYTHNQEEGGGCPQELANTRRKVSCSVTHIFAASPTCNTKASHTKNLHVGGAHVLCSSLDAEMLDWPRKKALYADDAEYCWFATIRTCLVHCLAGKGFVVATRGRCIVRALEPKGHPLCL
jgi:hypothetical protein